MEQLACFRTPSSSGGTSSRQRPLGGQAVFKATFECWKCCTEAAISFRYRTSKYWWQYYRSVCVQTGNCPLLVEWLQSKSTSRSNRLHGRNQQINPTDESPITGVYRTATCSPDNSHHAPGSQKAQWAAGDSALTQYWNDMKWLFTSDYTVGQISSHWLVNLFPIKRREVCHSPHSCTSTVRDRIQKLESRKSHCIIFRNVFVERCRK